MRQIRPRGGFFPAHPMPAPREAIKARVEIPAIVANKAEEIEIFSDAKGVTAFQFSGGVEVRIKDDVLMDALQRVQQPDFEIIGMGPMYGGGGLGGAIHGPLPQVEEHEEVFEGVIEGGQTKRLQVQPQVIFRGHHIEIDEETKASAFEIEDVRIGVDGHFMGTIPAEAFVGESSHAIDLSFDTASPGLLMVMVVKNRSKETLKFKAKIVGKKLT